MDKTTTKSNPMKITNHTVCMHICIHIYVCMSVFITNNKLVHIPLTNISSFKTTNTNANTSIIQFITNYIINDELFAVFHPKFHFLFVMVLYRVFLLIEYAPLVCMDVYISS